jgi:hypothetical protein
MDRWDALQVTIESWLVVNFGLNEPRDKDIWLFCIGAAMVLERLALGVLWIDDGRPGPFPEYKPTMALGQAARRIEARRLLDTKTRTVLKDVADLRNSVAHRHAVVVTARPPAGARPVGEYKGRHVFLDPEALDELVRDYDAAAKAMRDWMTEKAPDLAEEARRADGGDQGSEHPTPP